MVDVEAFKEDILLLSKATEFVRSFAVFDIVDIVFYSPHLLNDKAFMDRQKKYVKLLDTEYNNLLFVINSIRNLDSSNIGLIDLDDIFRVIRENYDLQVSLALNFTEYVALNDISMSRLWDIEEYQNGLIGNFNDYNFLYNQINLNNDSIKKIIRKEM